MPRKVSPPEIHRAMALMTLPQPDGSLMAQREIEKETGLSRPYLRKLAKKIGHTFPRNGIEVVGKMCMCVACGTFFRRAPSKAYRAKNNFCDELCRIGYMKGAYHGQWKDGSRSSTFSKWLTSQGDYKVWRKAALERAGNKCEITGKDDEPLDVHHLKPKASFHDLALDVNNALVVAKSIHREIHSLLKDGLDFDEAVEELRKKYKKD